MTTKCRSCPAMIDFRINLATNSRIPLVPLDPEYPTAPRYSICEDQRYCKRDDDGTFISHFSNCPGARQHSRGGKK